MLEADIIMQQCNTITTKAHGLSLAIARRYRWADVYGRRKPVRPGRNHAMAADRPMLGTIKLDDNGAQRVIHLFAQNLPGKSGVWAKEYHTERGQPDTPMHRVRWFRQCIEAVDELDLGVPIGVPNHIGCGLGGGDWDVYKKILETAKSSFVVYELEVD